MALDAIVFDVGETLVDETHAWTSAAEAAGLTPFTLMAGLGATIALGRMHSDVWELLGAEPQVGAPWTLDDWYPDALPCIERLRSAGFRVYTAANSVATAEEHLRGVVDGAASSGRWGVQKPAPEFFDRVCELAGAPPAKIAYVGDRVDLDIVPALAAGMVAVHIKRGPWGHLQEPPEGALRIGSLDELPGVFE
jgi:HAD superfamily hydrolase (TIGR01509 family)